MKTESIFVVDLQVNQVINVSLIGHCKITFIRVTDNDVYLETYRVTDDKPFVFEFTYPTFTTYNF